MANKQDEKQKDLNDMKREAAEAESQTIYFSCKMKVPKHQELIGDPEYFRLFWSRKIKEALRSEGEVRFLVLL